ncbi:MAG: PIN domain-containing protein [Propionibacteriaceae bacterium]|jgi:predicted nucleic acid-binding protein|nr:PIN domain-containing protein [Propionibacteriaceae bacterium]
MIVCDTNIASVLLQGEVHHDFLLLSEWLAATSPTQIYITAVTRAEISAGVHRLPDGHRKTMLANAVAAFVSGMSEYTLPFNNAAADRYALIMDARRRKGLPIAVLDAQIAAIAFCAKATLATRNVKDFVGVGLRIVNPYGDAG